MLWRGVLYNILLPNDKLQVSKQTKQHRLPEPLSKIFLETIITRFRPTLYRHCTCKYNYVNSQISKQLFSIIKSAIFSYRVLTESSFSVKNDKSIFSTWKTFEMSYLKWYHNMTNKWPTWFNITRFTSNFLYLRSI